MIGAFAVQAAIHAALTGAAVAGGRIYDGPAQGVAFPHVEIGEGQSLSDDAQCRNGTEDFFDLHIWSRYRGMKEINEIADAIHTALHDQALSATGRNVTVVRVGSLRRLRDPDGTTRHGVLTVRVLHTDAD